MSSFSDLPRNNMNLYLYDTHSTFPFVRGTTTETEATATVARNVLPNLNTVAIQATENPQTESEKVVNRIMTRDMPERFKLRISKAISKVISSGGASAVNQILRLITPQTDDYDRVRIAEAISEVHSSVVEEVAHLAQILDPKMNGHDVANVITHLLKLNSYDERKEAINQTLSLMTSDMHKYQTTYVFFQVMLIDQNKRWQRVNRAVEQLENDRRNSILPRHEIFSRIWILLQTPLDQPLPHRFTQTTENVKQASKEASCYDSNVQTRTQHDHFTPTSHAKGELHTQPACFTQTAENVEQVSKEALCNDRNVQMLHEISPNDNRWLFIKPVEYRCMLTFRTACAALGLEYPIQRPK